MRHRRPNPRLADCIRLLRTKSLWLEFPRDMRAMFLAQRGRCPYCGHPLQIAYIFRPNAPPAEVPRSTNRDHIWPRRFRPGKTNDLVLAHVHCNTEKGDRHPHPCEVLFGRFTAEITADITSALHTLTA